ncbi:MAG: hypothetical protein Q8Q20_00745 [bacterium]|nr:hypothetical protein [bacterium]
MKFIGFIALIALAAVAYFAVTARDELEVEETEAVAACQELCEIRLVQGEDLSPGPCLDEAVIPNWVCDVAHSPRKSVDDDPVNQCGSFRNKRAAHYIELDENCDLIRTDLQ